MRAEELRPILGSRADLEGEGQTEGDQAKDFSSGEKCPFHLSEAI